MAKKIIRVEIEVDDCVRCPDDAEDLSDMLYGIGDGQLDGSVTITDSQNVSDTPVVPNDPAYVITEEWRVDPIDCEVVVWNVDGLGPVIPLDHVVITLQDIDLAKIGVGEGKKVMDQAIEIIEEIRRGAAKKPVMRIADEFYPKDA